MLVDKVKQGGVKRNSEPWKVWVADIDDFAIDLIPSKCKASIVDTNPSFREKERAREREWVRERENYSIYLDILWDQLKKSLDYFSEDYVTKVSISSHKYQSDTCNHLDTINVDIDSASTREPTIFKRKLS